MARSLSARARATGIVRAGVAADGSSNVHVGVADLVALEAAVHGPGLWAKQPVHQLLAGRHPSRVRGRGLAFEELRAYVAGDDIRSIDWRVTARAGKPFVRVYSEEKDRPALILVDQRINMFFGSRLAMKSVAAAKVAALVAWRILTVGDRVGGLVFNDAAIEETKPHRSRAAVIDLATRIAAMNARLSVEQEVAAGKGQLDRALERAVAQAGHDHLVVVISDFDGHTAATRDRLLALTASNDVLAVLVYDPFLLELPERGEVVITGGRRQASLSLGRGGPRHAIAGFAQARGRELLAWQQELGLPMFPVSAAEDVVPQMRSVMERLRWQVGRR